MKVWTFQHPEAVRKLKETGILQLTWEDFLQYSPQKRHHKCYLDLAKTLKLDHPPIWAYLKRFRHFIDADFLSEFKEDFWYLHPEDFILLELDIPANLATLTSYYEWSDYLYFEIEEPDQAAALISWKHLFNVDDQTTDVQVLLPYLEKEWIVAEHKK